MQLVYTNIHINNMKIIFKGVLILKKLKISTSLILVLLMILTSSITIFASSDTALLSSEETPSYVANSNERAVWLEGCDTEGASAIDAVKWYYKGGKYYFFMPSSIDLTAVTVYHKFGNLNIGGQSIISGQEYDLSSKTNGSMSGDNSNYSFEIMQSENTGTVFITTESGSMSNNYANKDHKEPGEILVVSDDGSTIDYDKALDYIKGRGNTTWQYLDKKAFNIKLDKKSELMGMSESKKWTLLANGQEHSMLRNRFAYDMADEIGLEYSPESKFVEFYANGEYMGSYQLSEKVDAGDDNLVKINELESDTEDACAIAGYNDDLESYSRIQEGNKYYVDIPANPDDITGGYLMEINRSIEEISGFVSNQGNPIDLKYPEFASREQMMYISTFYQDMEDAMYSSSGYNSKGKHYSDYIDIEDAARMYIIMEFSMDVDTGISSCFMYKDSDENGDGKIHLSPVWDYDCALGNLTYTKDGVNIVDYNKMFASVSKITNVGNDTIFAALYKHSDFQSEVSRVWKEDFVPAYSIYSGETEATGRLQSFDTYKNDLLAASAEMNYIKWNLSDELLRPEIGYTHTAHINYLNDWNNGRFNFLNKMFLEIEDVKALAVDSVNAVYDDYSKKDITATELEQMTEIKDKAIIDINSASSTDTVNNIKDEAIYDIKAIVDSLVVYFDNSDINWSNVNAYWWGSSQTTSWPGKAMEKDGDMYKLTIPLDAANIIFNTNNGGTQTVDLTIDSSKPIFVINTNKTGTLYNGSWEAAELSLEEVQTAAKDEIIILYNSYDQATYTEDEYIVITEIKTKAFEDIDNATTSNEVTEIKTSAINDLKSAEATSIKYVKTDAIDEVNSEYAKYDSSDYSEDVYAQITQVKDNAITNINNATTKKDIQSLVETAKTEMQNIVNEALEDIKTQAIADVENAFNSYEESKFTSSEYAQLEEVKENAITDIENGTTANAVSTIKVDAIAEMKELSEDTLAIAKTSAIAELNKAYASYNSSDFTTEDYAQIKEAKNTGIENINNSTTKTSVTSAKTNAINGMEEIGDFIVMYFDNSEINWGNVYAYWWGSVETVKWPGEKMQADGDMFFIKIPSDATNIIFSSGSNSAQTVNLTVNKETPVFVIDTYKSGTKYNGTFKEVDKDINEVKDLAIDEINTLFSSYAKENYTDEEYDELFNIKTQAIEDIDNASTFTEINNIKTTAISELTQKESETIIHVKNGAKEELRSLQSEFLALEDEDYDFSNRYPSDIMRTYDLAIQELNTLTNIEDIEKLVDDTRVAMEAIVLEEISILRKTAKADIEDIFSTFDADKLTANEYEELEKIKDDAIAKIDNDTTGTEMDNTVAAASNQMQEFYDNSLYFTTESAIEEINNAYNAYDESEFSTEDYAEITSIKDNAIIELNSATTKAQVNSIVDDTISAMSEVGDFLVMYFDNSEIKWNNVYVYWWGSTQPTKWPGEMMDENGSMCSIKIPSDAKNIIFSNGYNTAQTIDLKIDKSTPVFNINTYRSGSKYGGTWEEK